MDLRIKDRQGWLTVVALAAVGVLALDKLILTPYFAAWKARSERIAVLDESVTRGEALLERADSLDRRWREMQREALPGDRSTIENDVLQAAARWARQSGLAFNSMTPQWKTSEPGHELFEVRAGATGDLGEIGRFLYELEVDPLAVKIDELQVAAQDERGRQLSMTLRFSGLRLLRTAQ